MGKNTILFLSAIFALSLSGCSGISQFEDAMVQKSGVLDDTNYTLYEEYSDNGNLDSEGYFVDSDTETTESHGQVHVTFADNSNLKIKYFTDAAHTSMVDTSDCYLNPGDSVFAEVSVDQNISSSMYEFSGFRIFEIDDEGERIESSSLKTADGENGQILEIPSDFEGTELSIEPIGAYPQRIISLNDFCTDDDGNKTSLSGTWIINDKEYTSDTIEISPITPYIISYKYDSDEYFFLSSSPECFYSDNEEGSVIFEQREADDETVDYSIELHKYISITLVSDEDRQVTINGRDKKNVRANEELTLPGLKYGDTVSIQTNKAWPDLETNQDLIMTGTRPEQFTNGDYRYTMLVPEKGGEFLFDPSDYTYEHGTITFKCFGQKVSTPLMLAKKSKIYYEQDSASPGYWLAGTDHYIEVGEEAETIAALQAIHFTPMVDVKVSLPQPDYGGSIVYKLNGRRIFTDSVSTYSGAAITMKVNPWEGWFIDEDAVGETTYIVGDSKSQIIKANGKNIYELLTEDEGHKPKLSLNLEQSVGKTMEFTLEASGLSIDVARYGGGWKVTDIIDKNSGVYDIISNKQTIVSKKKIGTEKPITITMSNRAIQSGSAVRMAITKTDSKDNKTKEWRYIDDLSDTIDPIYIYSPGTNATSTVWYKSIDITIGVVNVESYKPTAPEENTQITVKNNETGAVLNRGDLIEPDTKVAVTISPLPGYYVTGKNVSEDAYSNTMTFSDYQKNIDSIISGHPAKKYCKITLDKSDPYAEYTYKLDGKAVSGTINAKDGQKLELTYKITDPSYKLLEKQGGIVFGIGSSNTSVTKTITITDNMDGKRISKSDFGIETGVK